SHPLALLLAIPALAITVFAWRSGYANLSRRRLRVSLAVRIALLAAMILGLSGAALLLPQGRQGVVFVADLSGSDAGRRAQMQDMVNAAAAHRGNGDLMGVVDVGRNTVVEQPAGATNSFEGFQSSVDPNYTDLQS